MSDSVVIVSIARTPIGSMNGSLSTLPAHQLGAVAIKSALEKANVDPSKVDEVIIGNVLLAGQGQAPARQAAIGAGLPPSAPCSTLNKVCGSGMKTIMLAHDLLKVGSANVVVAGGQENMSKAPYLLLDARQGYRFGNSTVYDHMTKDGLEDAFQAGTAMGVLAEECVSKYAFTREEQDAFAVESLRRANEAIKNNSFKNEIAPVTISGRKGDIVIDTDEAPGRAMPEKIPALRPAFKKDGSITAANASSISDGAAALVLMRESTAQELGTKPVAKIVAHTQHAQEPLWFTTAPVGAIEKLLAKTGWKIEDVDLFEINEAFAAVTMAAMKELNIPHEKVNIYGGATALGHPIGASGARIVVTLINALQQTGGKRGIASLCIGGGEATAIAIELV